MDTFEGAVSARIPTFPDTGKPKGFAFIVFETAEAALEAYDKCQGQDLKGREMKVEFAFDKGNRGRSPGGGNFGGGNWDRGGGEEEAAIEDLETKESLLLTGSAKNKNVKLDSDSD
ncbi:hypothetical protein ACJMK2_040334 [Sinanodonta woodiana]|uniref:RRM domain-containing protein n=1 Tax=Sinanodonta woodiana TaxID=1069815 RepID=A0ABD3WI61_SINWO